MRYASGSNEANARNAAANINYTIQQNDSNLLISKGFIVTQKQKFRNQQVIVVLEIPIGKRIELDQSVRSRKWITIFADIDWYSDFHGNNNWRPNQEYIMTIEGLKKVEKPEIPKENAKGIST